MEIRAWARSMKTVAEYLEQALHFQRMAAEATNPTLQQSFEKQAEAYRKLAEKRSAVLKLPPINLPAIRSDKPTK
jgi:TATA-binding protein-associated factor Taf7